MRVFSLAPAELEAMAAREGFDRAALAPLEGAGGDEAPGGRHGPDAGAYLEEWIARGYAGEMEYLKRRSETGELLRARVGAALPWARSVVVCAARYDHPGPRSIDPAPPASGWIARYAWAGQPDESGEGLGPSDYHDTLLVRLRRLEQALRERLDGRPDGRPDGRSDEGPDGRPDGRADERVDGPAAQPFLSRCYVDTGPLLERDLARRAGLGWTGKNTCTLSQQMGSMFFLGCIVTSLEVPAALVPEAAEDRCGTCRRCIEACPTGALVAPREMDASRCIAYLTIEKRGAIPEELRPALGRHVFGCDICQEVCPWVQKAAARPRSARPMSVRPISVRPPSVLLPPGPNHAAPGEAEETAGRPASPEPASPGASSPGASSPGPASPQPRRELVNPPLDDLAALDPRQFNRLFRGSPVERTRRRGLLRNVAIAMGNGRDRRFLPRLEQWAAAEDDPVLAEAAAWAIRRIASLQ